MEVGSISSAPRTVEEIFRDYGGRRAGIVRALTHGLAPPPFLSCSFFDLLDDNDDASFFADVDAFYAQCDPGESNPIFASRIREVATALVFRVRYLDQICFGGAEKENLCLYGHPNDSWEVNLPAEEVPPELPEPALGINFARDGMDRRDWLSLIAVHSDSWLLSVAFYLGARLNRNDRYGFDSFSCYAFNVHKFAAFSGSHKNLSSSFTTNRKRLFSMINDLPTVYEVVAERRQSRERSGTDSGSKSKLSTKRSSDGQEKNHSRIADEGYGEDDDEHSETLCGACGGSYSADEFWIACDVCERWFHGKCVKITPAKAESIKQYKCPSCSSKKGRHLSPKSWRAGFRRKPDATATHALVVVLLLFLPIKAMGKQIRLRVDR
ncbi:hypothetical protein Cni_G15616 [Canna indica]|uniref:PHD finger protein ALFIN-LIKE n=1 Tax=Canna indica TaxID=4628 RepID=A0AAQ3KE41_9LILI|nr:hypothetical protein Cni_G15616 [Canna indica]